MAFVWAKSYRLKTIDFFMLEKPDIADEHIIAILKEQYGLVIVSLEFLPIGNASNTWVYRVGTAAQPCFLKVKKESLYQPSLIVPRFLKDAGIDAVVAPLPTLTGNLWTMLEPFTLVLYPFIDGVTAMEQGMSLTQWTTFGTILKQIHSTPVPSDLLAQMQHEKFVLNPQWLNVIRQIQEQVHSTVFDDPFARELAAFWQEKETEIVAIVDRAIEIGRSLQNKPLDIMLCHADIHTANMLVDQAGDLFIVDWDQPVIAPKERDLMFVLGTSGNPSAEEAAFFLGYGSVHIDRAVLAYYRYEWVVQEFGDYGERVFFATDGGDETKRDSVCGFRQLFDPGDVVEAARLSD